MNSSKYHPSSNNCSPLTLGPVDLAISGENSLARWLQDELGAYGNSGDLVISPSSRDLQLGKVISAQNGSRGLLKFNVTESSDGLSLSMGTKMGFDLYRVRMSGNPSGANPVACEIDIPLANDQLDLLMRPLTKVLTRDYSSLTDVIAKNVLYEIIDPMLWCRLLNANSTLAHAAAAETPDGGGVLIMGTGGVGKSTTILSLVRDLGWRYISDDLVVLADKEIIRYPKRLQVYAYNAMLVQGLEEDLLKHRSTLDQSIFRMRHKLFGPKAARRRISGGELFGSDAVANRAKLKMATLLIGTDASADSTVETVSPETLAQLGAATIIDEFWDYCRSLNGLATINADFPSVGELFERTRDVITQQLSDIPAYIVRVPARTPGAELGKLLESVAKDID